MRRRSASGRQGDAGLKQVTLLVSTRRQDVVNHRLLPYPAAAVCEPLRIKSAGDLREGQPLTPWPAPQLAHPSQSVGFCWEFAEWLGSFNAFAPCALPVTSRP